jgi:hypothetical protein
MFNFFISASSKKSALKQTKSIRAHDDEDDHDDDDPEEEEDRDSHSVASSTRELADDDDKNVSKSDSDDDEDNEDHADMNEEDRALRRKIQRTKVRVHIFFTPSFPLTFMYDTSLFNI